MKSSDIETNRAQTDSRKSLGLALLWTVSMIIAIYVCHVFFTSKQELDDLGSQPESLAMRAELSVITSFTRTCIVLGLTNFGLLMWSQQIARKENQSINLLWFGIQPVLIFALIPILWIVCQRVE